MVTVKIPFFDLAKTADSGQAFRIKVIDVIMDKWDLSEGKDTFAFSCSEKDFEEIWTPYLDLGRDYKKIVKSIDKNDEYLLAAAKFGEGIRILKQDIFETVISYIISQRRSIPSITTSVERISKLCGKKIPTPAELNKLPFSELENTGVGYRAPYISRAAEDFASGKLNPESLSKLSDEDLYKTLMSMFGVGTKVANCVMLFAFARTGRFPVDVWIQRIEDKYYNGHFDCTPYPETAGIMQQFMFYYERRKPQD